MIDHTAICEEIYQNPSWITQRVMICLKQVPGKLFIDIRKWTDKNGKLQPSKGIMLSVDDWPPIISMIQKMIEKNCNSGFENEVKKV